MTHALRIACPKWSEDGPWPSDFEHACKHIRIEISLPLPVDVVVGICNLLDHCSCGEKMVILNTAPESKTDLE